MLLAVLLRDPHDKLYAPGFFLGQTDLTRQIRRAGGTPGPDWLTDQAVRSYWPDGDSFTKIDCQLLRWIDSPVTTWLLGTAYSLSGLLPQIDRLLLLKYPDQLPELAPNQQLRLSMADLAEAGYEPQAGTDADSFASSLVYLVRPSAAALMNQVMMAGDCDLHLHTSRSDGADTPEQMVDRVIANSLRTFAITDHDNLSGLEPARRWLASRQSQSGNALPYFIPGVELSIEEERELHLLGYFPRGGMAIIEDYLIKQRELRRLRNEKMIRQLQELGYPISLADFQATGSGTLGRLQAARLLRDRGHFPSISAAFDELLGTGRPGYVERQRPSPAEAIWLIRQAGGVAVLAHPHLYGWCGGQAILSGDLMRHLQALQMDGLQGVEAFHGEASAPIQREISAAALALGLIRTGGSDDHGINKEHTHLYLKGMHWLNRPEILVVAAIIKGPDRDGQPTWLLTRRSSPGHGRGYWEFPGGKVEPGETLSQALARELAEELAVHATIGRQILVLSHDYPERRVVLVCLAAILPEKTWQLSVHDDARFATAQEALDLQLLPADIQIFKTLLNLDVT